MKLATWLRQKEVTQQDFGSRIGSSQAQVARFAADKRMPNRATMQRIFAETGGAVTANDFFDVRSDGMSASSEPAVAA